MKRAQLTSGEENGIILETGRALDEQFITRVLPVPEFWSVFQCFQLCCDKARQTKKSKGEIKHNVDTLRLASYLLNFYINVFFSILHQRKEKGEPGQPAIQFREQTTDWHWEKHAVKDFGTRHKQPQHNKENHRVEHCLRYQLCLGKM